MKIVIITGVALLSLFAVSCGGESKPTFAEELATEENSTTNEVAKSDDFMSNKGIGPITSVVLGDIDNALVEKGKTIFLANCSACHKFEKRVIGPALSGITERRSSEWIMNMILNPEEMVEKDPIAKDLLAEYIAPMANQNLTEEEARAILELFRTKK